MITPRSLAAFAAVVMTVGTSAQPASIFPELTFNDAVERAQAAGKPLLLYVSAEWAPSERQMRRSTWEDDSLLEYVADRVSGVYIDADTNPTAARELNAIAFPTMILIQPDGTRIGRPLVGFKTTDQVRAWMQNNLGERVTSAFRADAPSSTNLPATVISGVQREANGDDEGALTFLIWCWQNVSQIDQATGAARRSFLARPMRRLCARSSDALEQYTELRDASEQRLRSDEFAWEDLRDWIVLNDITGQTQITLDWVSQRANEGQIAELRRLESELLPILLRERKLEELQIVAPNPSDAFDRLIKNLNTMVGSDIDALNVAVRDYVRDAAAELYSATLAQGRDQVADELARLIISRIGEPENTRAALISAALEWDQPRAVHLTWLDRMNAASQADEVQLRADVEAALDR